MRCQLSLKQNLGESSYMWSNIVPISCGSVNGEVSLGSDFLLRILGMEKVGAADSGKHTGSWVSM